MIGGARYVHTNLIARDWLGHIAFAVPSVPDARAEVLAAGGRAISEVVTLATAAGHVTWCYVTDPEGNIVELQTWSSDAPGIGG